MNVLGVACCAMPLIVVFNNNNMQNNGYCVWGEVKKWISALSCFCLNILKHFCKYLYFKVHWKGIETGKGQIFV